MKRFLLFFFLFMSGLTVLAQQRYMVKGTFKCKYEGWIYLMYGDEKDSVRVKSQAFSFTKKVGLPVYASLKTASEKTVSIDPFYLGDGEVVVTLDTVTRTGRRKTGTFSYLSMQTVFLKKGRTDQLVDSVTARIAERSKVLTEPEARNAEIRNNVLSFLSSHPNTVASVAILHAYMRAFSQPELKKIYESLRPEIKETADGKAIFGATVKVIAVALGDQIPDFSQKDIKGKEVSITSLRGKYVLIDFWASWCVPCRAENPAVLAAYKRYQAKGFEILGVSLDLDRSSWLKAIKTDGLSWLQVSDLNGWSNEVSKTFGINSIPDNFLIDPAGKIIARGLRGADLEKKLAAIFTEGKSD